MKVEWLRQVFVKSGANSKFALLRVRCQGDGFFPGLTLSRFGHQVEPASVGEPNIAEQDFETQVVKQNQRVLHVGRGRDLIAAVGQETGKDLATVRVILDQ